MGTNDSTLAAITKAIGKPPRRFSRFVRKHQSPPRPGYAHPPDEIAKIYDLYPQTLKNGVVHWAAIVHANTTLYEPGDSMAGCQVVYCETPIVLEDLLAMAKRTFETKGTAPDHPAVRKIADMLTNEMERALDWPLPDELAQGHAAYTTVVKMHRAAMPDGFIGHQYFPIVADPGTRYAALVPYEYWPNDLVDTWLAKTQATKHFLVSQPIVTLTERCAGEINSILEAKGLVDIAVRVWLLHDDGGAFNYQLDLTPNDTPRPDHEERVSYGLTILVPKNDVQHLRGCEIDFLADEAGTGFVFNNPRASSA